MAACPKCGGAMLTERPGDHRCPTIDEIIDRAGAAAKERHSGVLPDGFAVVRRRYGRHGYGWVAKAPAVTTFTRHDEDEAWRQIWWAVASEEKYQELQRQKATA